MAAYDLTVQGTWTSTAIALTLLSWNTMALAPGVLGLSTLKLWCKKVGQILKCTHEMLVKFMGTDPQMRWHNFKMCHKDARKTYQIARFTWPTWGPPGSCRPQVGPCWPHEPCYQGYPRYKPSLSHPMATTLPLIIHPTTLLLPVVYPKALHWSL